MWSSKNATSSTSAREQAPRSNGAPKPTAGVLAVL
jgi:hypothetical protein